jgi:hypothetical protein
MKAKEYAAKYLASPTRETMTDIACAFDADTVSLVKARNVKSDQAFKSILREMDDKWRAFARIAGCNPDGYRIIMRKLHPTTAAFAWPE